MPQHDHPFIDIAALDGVRERFLAGDALALLTTDLQTIVWANGPGAELFGQPGVEAARGAESGLSFAARRQIAATPGFPAIGANRPMLVRMAVGVVPLAGSAVTLPDGEPAVLLARPAVEASPARAISGIGQDGSFAALFDAEGAVLAASAGFDDFGIEAQTLRDIAGRIAGEADRLLKQPVAAGGLVYPAGIARIADDPARMLIIVVDAPQEIVTEAQASRAAPSPALPAVAAAPADDTDSWYFADAPRPAAPRGQAPVIAQDDAPDEDDAGEPDAAAADQTDADWTDADDIKSGEPPGPPEMAAEDFAHEADPSEDADADKPEGAEPDRGDPPLEARDGGVDNGETVEPATGGEASAGRDDAGDAGGSGDTAPPQDAGPVAEAGPSVPDRAEDVADDGTAGIAEPAEWPPADATPEAADAEPATGPGDAPAPRVAAPTFEPDLNSGPVRFVWKTDAAGRFSTVSESFAGAVGGKAANVVGRSFREVADAFGLDPDGDIADLLERRDTWSGRTVMWPIEATDLRVPVDLAALPVYGRDRAFEGFRGFGVVRVADAVVDPDAAGLDLGAEPAPEPVRETLVAADPFQGEAPAIAMDETPERRQADKVIRLAEHRPGQPERALSPNEATAFREIGARLKETEEKDRPVEAANENGSRQAASTADRTQDVEPAPAGAGLADDDAPATGLWAVEADEEEGDGDGGEPADLDAVARQLSAILAADEGDDGTQPGAGASEAAPPSDGERQDDAADIDEPIAETIDEDGIVEGLAAQEDDDPVDDAPAGETGDDAPVAQVSADAAAPQHPDAGETPSADLEQEAWNDDEDMGGDEPRRPASVDTSILSRLPVPVLIHSGDTLHYANGEFLDLTGYVSLLELQQAGGLDAIFADAPADPDDQRRRLVTRDGDEFPVEALLQSVPWQGGKALLLAIRRSAQPETAAVAPVDAEALTELESRVAELNTILDTATDGIVIIARDGAIRSLSSPAEALFGFDASDVVGKPFSALFAVESQRAARDYLAGLSDHGVASVLNDGREVIGREAQGRFIPLFMTIGRLPGNSGFCAVLRDITQWKRAEEELTQARSEAERASSQKTEFLARISHEIRTPLNAIIGFSELMIDEKFGPVANERYRDYLRDINRSGNHVLDLVNDLLDISKIEAGEQEMSYEAVSLNDTLAEVVAMMQPQANRDRVIIRSSFASRLPEVVADLRSVRQIALNLLSNAVRYTQPGGQVIVSTAYEPSGDVVMRVRDTGVGMSSAEIEQALKPFKQINALKRQRGDGTGLGLPLTKAMVEANRARFLINSTPGEGTLVEVVFPSTRVLAG